MIRPCEVFNEQWFCRSAATEPTSAHAEASNVGAEATDGVKVKKFKLQRAGSIGKSDTGTFDNKNAGLRMVNVNSTNTTLRDDTASGGLTSNYQLVTASVTTIAKKTPW